MEVDKTSRINFHGDSVIFAHFLKNIETCD